MPLHWKVGCSIHVHWVNRLNSPWAWAFTSTAPTRDIVQDLTWRQMSIKKSVALQAIQQKTHSERLVASQWVQTHSRILQTFFIITTCCFKHYTVCWFARVWRRLTVKSNIWEKFVFQFLIVVAYVLINSLSSYVCCLANRLFTRKHCL